MPNIIERGKQQILFNYLPGRIFDFKKSVFARVERVRGHPYLRLNHSLVVRKIIEHASAWDENIRPSLRDEVLRDESRFIIIDPSFVTSELFPLVFRCSNNQCNRVFDYSRSNQLPRNKTCPHCNSGRLDQLRFIRIHQCGHVEPLVPWSCRTCQSNEIALDFRNSERIVNFRWRCLSCGNTWPIRGGKCNRCSWPNGNPRDQEMSVEVFRANRTYYVHTATLLNIPEREYDDFFNLNDWYVISTAKYLGIQPISEFNINQYANSIGTAGNLSSTISEAAFGELLEQLNRGEISVERYTQSLQELRNQSNPSIEEIKTQINSNSGINLDEWESSKYDVIDTIIPFEIGAITELDNQEASTRASNLGIEQLTLIDDFPIILASYGFSRMEARPYDNNRNPLCYLNPFPADREQGGRYPVYVDKVQADAILIQLNPNRVISWLSANGCSIIMPQGSVDESSRKGYFINLFSDVNIFEKIFGDRPIERLVLGLIHTYSHLAIRHAALLCGLDKTSISEYIVPKTLSVAIYCNHRFGATIGALTALFEQSVLEWLDLIENERRCVYDPVCYEKGGNCHSCTHLAETSCKLFNQNLSRIYLFGGYDKELEREIIGYFDSRVSND